jgi:antibiotic biosynthesis monooxygenase (ABM) superfamily enzyme
MRNEVKQNSVQRSFPSRNNFKPNFITSFVLLGTVFSLKLVTYFFICHFDETTRRHFEKTLNR